MFIIGLSLTVVGAPLMLYAFYLINRYSNNPFARLHDYQSIFAGMSNSDLLIVAMFGLLLTLVGICLMVSAKKKQQDMAKARSLENMRSNNYCSHCRTNVSSNDGTCPICHNRLGGML